MAAVSQGVLSMGQNTLSIPLELFSLNRIRLCAKLKTTLPNAIVLLQGGNEIPFNDTDTNYYVFRQESYFMWTFGVLEPGCYGAIIVSTFKAILFIPRVPLSYTIWMGPQQTLVQLSEKYRIDTVYYVDEMTSVLLAANPSKLLILKGINSDSGLESKGAEFDGIHRFVIDSGTLFNVIAELRVIKSDMEIEVLKYVTEISSEAHRAVMKMAKPGVTEYQCESTFMHYCYTAGGCRFMSYTCICSSGQNGSILHYGHAGAPNNKIIGSSELCLFDMGANYFGYSSDITCTFPANGKFTNDQKLIYNIVYNANQAVFDACRPGVSWLDMHNLAIYTVLTGLKDGGILIGSVNEMVAEGFGLIFQPHGVGHLIGLDVHDVGGYLTNQPRKPQTIQTRLRTARILQKGMCLTIEPGCYFIDALLDQALSNPQLSKFIVPTVLKRFRGFGGVRIEDDVYITETGCVNMTKVPRTINEIEDWIAGKDNDSKYKDAHLITNLQSSKMQGGQRRSYL